MNFRVLNAFFFSDSYSGRGWLYGILLALSLPTSTLAGTLYKCAMGNDQIAYTNKLNGFHNCHKVSNYTDKPNPAADKSNVTYHSSAAAEVTPDGQPSSVGANTNASTAPTATSVAPPRVQRGAVYKVNHGNGITEYTNIRPSSSGAQLLFTYIATCYACDVHSTINWGQTPLRIDAYRDEITQAATQFGVDATLLRAMIHAESAFNPNAISSKGAQGLMQLMPGTASDLAVSNPFDPGQNIRGGAQYLSGLLKNFNGDEKLATAAYNAGAANIQKYGGIPPFEETRVYVERVATLRQRYQQAQ